MIHQSIRHLAASEHAAGIVSTYRRVSYVRIDPVEGTAVLVGVRHRLPTEVAISIEVAEALRVRGVPAIVRSQVAS